MKLVIGDKYRTAVVWPFYCEISLLRRVFWVGNLRASISVYPGYGGGYCAQLNTRRRGRPLPAWIARAAMWWCLTRHRGSDEFYHSMPAAIAKHSLWEVECRYCGCIRMDERPHGWRHAK